MSIAKKNLRFNGSNFTAFSLQLKFQNNSLIVPIIIIRVSTLSCTNTISNVSI
jgi:hypothetical protein